MPSLFGFLSGFYWLRKISVFIIFFVIVFFLFIYIGLKYQAEFLVEKAMHGAGFPEATLEEASLSWNHIKLQKIRLKPEQPAFSLSLPLSKIRERRFENFIVTVETPLGELPIRSNGAVLPHGQELKYTSTLSSDSNFLSFQGKMEIYFNLTLRTVKGRIDFENGSFQHGEIAAQDMKGWVTAERAPEGTPEKIDIRLEGKPDFIPIPFVSNIILTKKEDAFDFKGNVSDKNGSLYIRLNGLHHLSAKEGRLDFTLTPFRLAEGVNSLETIFPALSSDIKETTGEIGFKGKANWKNNAHSLSGDLLLKDVSATVQGTPLYHINSVFHFDSLSPITFQKQVVAIGGMDAGIPLTNGLFAVSLDPRQKLTVHSATWDLAKGELTADPFSFSLKKPTFELMLNAKNLDLAELFKVSNVEGLDATGLASGTLPVALKEGVVGIENGILEATVPGTIRYNPKEPPAFLNDPSNKQIVDLRTALKLFNFDKLKLTLNGRAGESQKIILRAEGKNPEFYKARPVHINLQLEGPLQNVLKMNASTSEIPDHIRSQIEAYQKENADE